MITGKELRSKFLQFFKDRGHAIIPSASLIPENDPTVLFTTAGMHPLTPYLLGQNHPMGRRLADVQKCVRTIDIDEVGDASHLTFFEMLGNWSLGDYFKEQSIKWSYEFLTDEKYLGIAPEKLSVTVFCGDADAPRDEQSAKLWLECGIKEDHIYYLPKKNNWWGPAGITGPCGSDTEIFYDTGKDDCSPECSPACDCGKWLEIWNNVFMEYNKNADGSFSPLAQCNVDTGMGLERAVCVLNGLKSVYETDLFADAVDCICKLANVEYGKDKDTTRAIRIIADHIRTAVFLLGDRLGITPSNVDQGYVLRRIIRRAVRYAMQLGIDKSGIDQIAVVYLNQYQDVYPELKENREKVIDELSREQERFGKTLVSGEKEFHKITDKLESKIIDGKNAFRLYDTFGFPIELTEELAHEKGLSVDVEAFKACYAEHQTKSQIGSEQHFKGGLQDNSEATSKLHTATHLLQAALRKILGDEVKQKGSNITAERLRFDFSFHRPMTPEEVAEAQRLVNDAIERKIPVIFEEMPIEEAREKGAMGLFGDKYGEIVKVYTIGDVSMEMCGGPHATNTGELGEFVITKEQSSSSGVRRIKAELH
ncbi:MAG: alanine--tRNA ligase [Clostridia bacterium]|nr:alanine--tRNA ligase [Clostridia bacterium]